MQAEQVQRSTVKFRRFFRTALLLLPIGVFILSGALPAFAQGPGDSIFLPLLSSGGSGGGNPPPTQPPPTQRSPTQTPPDEQPITIKKFFVEPDTKTTNAAVAIDPDGGKHLAYNYYLPYAEHPAAVYLYCPPNLDCGEGANWSGVSMLDEVEEVQMALTPDGNPRLLVKTGSSHSQDGTGFDFYYVACDGNCTDPALWEGTYVSYIWGTAMSDIGNHDAPQRYFALDHLGRPRFVYYDRNYQIEPDHWGSFYAWCDSNCTDGPEAWNHTLIGNLTSYDAEIYEWPSLTFTANGQPRLVTNIFAIDPSPDGVYYVACDANCGDGANWDRVHLFERGSTSVVAWDIDVDVAGRMHLAFYKGDTLDGSGLTLYYGICNSGCLTKANWTIFDMGFPVKAGEDVDLTIDRLGRPRLAFINGGDELEFAWCDSGCDLVQNWTREVIDTTAQITDEWQPALPTNCDAGFWNTLIPSIAVGPDGEVFIAYDAKYDTRCWLKDPTDPTKEVYTFHQLWHTVRGVIFPQP